MRFVPVAANTYELGWRFTSALPDAALESLSSVVGLQELFARFSPRRTVALAAFEIATTSIPFQDLIGDPYELEEIASIEALCSLIDEKLAPANLRLPTEDELEAAAGGSLFAWGTELPEGIPYGNETSFTRHKEPNALGLTLNSDPYQLEICRHALKLGDGGSAICGGDPWPMAWLSLSPCFRLSDDDVAECFVETLEATRIRPVRWG